MHWPDAQSSAAAGTIVHDVGYLPDMMPTVLAAARAEYPATFHEGTAMPPLTGNVLLPVLEQQLTAGHDYLFWEHEDNCGVRHVLLGAKDINWRGRGNTIEAFYQYNDGEHGFLAAVTNPSLYGSRWGYFLELRRYAAREPLYFPTATVDYRYANLSGGIGASYTHRSRQVYRLGINLFREDYRRLGAIEVGPERLRQTKFLVKLSRDDDRRDYLGERQRGLRNTTVAQTVLTGRVATPFFIGWHEVRYYGLPDRSGNFAARLRVGISTNDDTPFAPFFVDSQFNIRGIGNRIDRGTAQLVLNLEYRHSFLRGPRNRFVFQAEAFSDLSNWRDPSGELGDLLRSSSLKHFVGGGLRLASPRISSAVVRVDYGIDVANANRGGIVVGYGQFF